MPHLETYRHGNATLHLRPETAQQTLALLDKAVKARRARTSTAGTARRFPKFAAGATTTAGYINAYARENAAYVTLRAADYAVHPWSVAPYIPAGAPEVIQLPDAD